MKVYTRTGDTGETQLFGGARIPKDEVRVEAYGAVDEVIAALAVAQTHGLGESQGKMLSLLMNRLFTLNAQLATPGEAPRNVQPLTETDVTQLEEWIDELDAELPALTQFILPGGTPLAAELHLARTIARRAERRMISLHRQEGIDPVLIKFVNRLSDFLFVLARDANRDHGGDVPATF